jgi:WD40 repeat protein
LISTSLDTTCRIWDVRTGALISTINKVLSCGFTPDKNYLLLQTEDGDFILWDAGNRGEVRSLDLGTPLKQAWFSRDGGTIYVATEGDELFSWKWSAPGGKAASIDQAEISKDIAPPKTVLASPDGSIQIEIDGGYEMQMRDNRNNRLLFKGRISADTINDIQFSPDSTKLAIAFGSTFIPRAVGDPGWAPIPSRGEVDLTAGIWDLKTGEKTAVLRGFTNSVSSVNFSPDSNYIVAASSDGFVRIYLVDLNDLETLARQRITRTPAELTCEERIQFLAESLACPTATPGFFQGP